MRILPGIAALWLVVALPARADDALLTDRFTVDAGWFFLSTSTSVRVDGETTQITGTNIDFDETFGVDDTDRFRVDVLWRFANRHALRGMYFENNGRGSRELTRDIRFGDEVFPADASVSAASRLTVAQLSYDYAFMQRPSYELAAGIGLHLLDMGLALDTTITGSGGEIDRSISESASTQQPLPVLGFRALWRLSEQVFASAQAQYFYLEFDEYQGSLSDLKAQVVWQFSRHIGIGVGYNDFRFRFNIDGDRNFNGRLRTGYGGALLFLSATF
jgi:hypothetical protein